MASREQRQSRPELTRIGDPSKDRCIPGAERVEVPVGLEMVLFQAARDESFKRRLLADRETAIAESTIPLGDSERAMLRVTTNAALEQMIRRVEPANQKSRPFMGKVAAAVTSLAAGTVAGTILTACEQNLVGGAGPAFYVGGSGGEAGDGGRGGAGGGYAVGGAGGADGGAGGAGGGAGGADGGAGG